MVAAILTTGCAPSGESVRTPPKASTMTPSVVVTDLMLPTSASSGWSDVAERVAKGVVRITVMTCDKAPLSMGTGFVVGPHTIMTAYHVVDDAPVVQIQLSGSGPIAADVVAVDPVHDAALLYVPSQQLPYVLTLSSHLPRIGEQLAILGFPDWSARIQFSQGATSGEADGPTRFSGSDIAVEGLYLTTAPVNGGNSGGPLFSSAGEVLGLVVGVARRFELTVSTQGTAVVTQTAISDQQGRNYFQTSSTLTTTLAAWKGSTAPLNTACQSVRASTLPTLRTSMGTSTEGAAQIAQLLTAHGTAINSGDYYTAWSMFTQRQKTALGSFDQWSAGMTSTTWDSLTIVDVSGTATFRSASVVLVTSQNASDGYQGQTCSVWALTYDVARDVDARWFIDKVKSIQAPTAC